MNKVVDMVKIAEQKDAGIQELNKYIESAVEMNKGRIALAIENKINGADAQSVLDTFTDYIIGHAFTNFSQEKLIEYISNGTLFKARSMLIEKLISDEEINATMRLLEAV